MLDTPQVVTLWGLSRGAFAPRRRRPQRRWHRDPGHPLRYLLHETWAGHRDGLETQLPRPYRAAWHAALPELLEPDREISMWPTLRSDSQQSPVPE